MVEFNKSVVINVVDGDTDSDGTIDSTSITITTQPSSGTVTVNTDGTLQYTHTGNSTGSDSLKYTVKDNEALVSNIANVLITITDTNNPPVAVNDTTATEENTAVLIDVLDNDSDPDGDVLSIVSFGADNATENNGTLTREDQGTTATDDDEILYTPATGFFGTDSFSYVISDGNEQDTALVFITIVENNPPLAVNDTIEIGEGDEVVIEVLANDSDRDDDVIEVTEASSQNGGTVRIVDDEILYSPPLDFCGEDVIDYVINDPEPLYDSAQVIITVIPDDTDGDGIYDFIETTTADTDGDGTPNFQDTDSDNDGIPDADEVIFIDACTIEFPDSDKDGLADYFDADIVIFDSFTPDGDGVNDSWVIEDIESFPDNTVRLFNRWGNLIYEERGYNNQDRSWEANRTNGIGFGSSRVPDGTYFYLIDLGNGTPSRSGFVVIKR